MAFDIQRRFDFCRLSVGRFAPDHSGETFYAFAIDANLLCLNSLEAFAKTLEGYQSRWDRRTRFIESISDMTYDDWRYEQVGLKIAEKHDGLDRRNEEAVLALINESRSRRRAEGCTYRTSEGIRDLRDNTGDWDYHFASMDENVGFDDELYDDHYDEAMGSDDGHAPHTDYAIAMTELVDRLRRSDIFRPLKMTDDFRVSWVDHDY
jgi:hypothetical protein